MLDNLNIIQESRLELYHPRVRDRSDISVLRDPATEVIVLSRVDHITEDYYDERKEKNTYTVHENELFSPKLEDNLRRAKDIGRYIRNKRWLDVGSGLGGMLDEMANEASWAAGVELNKERSAVARRKGHKIFEDLADIEPGSLEIITLFHVLEHIPDPIKFLTTLKPLLRPGGILLLEVPHARDALFTLYDCEPFKSFTFWSEHLLLHTRSSLCKIIKEAGYHEPEVVGFQRYPLANHLYWLSQGRPGGHEQWQLLSRGSVDSEYQACLAAMDRTDTLLAICQIN